MCLQVKELEYRYSSRFGLENINLDFDRGITALIGPNGAGKSTLIKCIAHFLKWQGKMYYKKEEINHSDKIFFTQKMGYLPQFSLNDATITVFEAVLLGLIGSLKMKVTALQREAVENILDTFRLYPLAQRSLYELSGGQVQMVLLAQAMIKAPEILLLDEPLNNLDIHRQFALLNILSRLSRKKKMITVIVMHDLHLAARYADRIVLMDRGRLH